jgi:hypothetical protein
MKFEFNLLAPNPITIYQGTSKDDITASINWTSGNSETIIITSSNLPSGVSFNPRLPKTYDASTFTLNSASTIVLPELKVTNTAPAGTYPIIITATTSNGISKTITINLVIAGCITQNENTAQGTYKGSWNILTIPALADTITILNFLNIPDNKVLLNTKALNPLVFIATINGNNFTIADVSLPSLPIGPINLTNVTINGSGSFDCTGKIISLTMRFVSGNITLSPLPPISIAGQSFSGTFTL